MINNLESNYDCSNAGQDLEQLQHELATMQATSVNPDKETKDLMNRLENQIHFIKNKCDIRP
ncbi:DUF2524 domain-containing protein [Paenibacillus sp. GD4]|jgi:hypothetical protein|uniref:DUF2524 domain-containing protein n=1 Tax=Paenibacillus TaxID=44249 RepID=UPI00254307C3|nr:MULTISPECIES: DUF2524 domain-containing protein [Paenibacillus]MDQ1909510.1 DUF2524 domain-containing protein [Paenibacillus sp. GD4]